MEAAVAISQAYPVSAFAEIGLSEMMAMVDSTLYFKYSTYDSKGVEGHGQDTKQGI